MRTLGTRIISIKLRQYADSRTTGRFPNDLLSLEQNKDAPFLNKERVVWTFSEDSRPYRIARGRPLILPPSLFLIETIGSPSPTDPEMSPVLASSHANLPPTFFQICGLDPIRDDAFLYDRLLREAGCETFVKVYVRFQQRATDSSLR